MSSEAVQPETPEMREGLVVEKHSREGRRGMNWDRELYGPKSANGEGLNQGCDCTEGEERVDLAAPRTWREQMEAILQRCLDKWKCIFHRLRADF